jgi:hypothetical protein
MLVQIIKENLRVLTAETRLTLISLRKEGTVHGSSVVRRMLKAAKANETGTVRAMMNNPAISKEDKLNFLAKVSS